MIKRHSFSTALLALLFMGSASLWAAPLSSGEGSEEGSDSFGAVNDTTYANTMSITGYVRFVNMVNGNWETVNDEVLGNETVVGVFCGNELRGKASPKDYLNGAYKSLLMMNIYGETKGQPLHFKVYVPGDLQSVPGDLQSPGRVIEVDQGLTFTNDARIGKADAPYYINLPLPVNTTFSKEGWATTCLPFHAYVPDGVTLYAATGINLPLPGGDDSGKPGVLAMKKVESTVLPANTPVLLGTSASGDVQSKGIEWLSRVIDTETLEQFPTLLRGGDGDGTSILKGTVEPTDVTANSVLTLGHANEGEKEIGFWLYTRTTIPANRAYITDFPTGTNGARIAIGDEATSVQYVALPTQQTEQVYDLQGRRVSSLISHSSPLKKGLYIMGGKKVVYK